MRKAIINEHIDKMDLILKEIEGGGGSNHRIAMSYKKGFTRGLAALTQSEILDRKI